MSSTKCDHLYNFGRCRICNAKEPADPMAMPIASPKRIQRQRTKGWKMPDSAIYVGRPTQWGNPFVLTGDWIVWAAVALGYRGDEAGRRQASVKLYRAWLTSTLPEVEKVRGNYGAIQYANGKEVPTQDHVQGLASVMTALFQMPNMPDSKPALTRLRGKDLACFCPLNQPCHADVLLEIANRSQRERV